MLSGLAHVHTREIAGVIAAGPFKAAPCRSDKLAATHVLILKAGDNIFDGVLIHYDSADRVVIVLIHVNVHSLLPPVRSLLMI